MKTLEPMERQLREADLRPTRVRMLILKTLVAAKDHPSTDELFERITKQGERVGRATVYQNLEKLVAAGLVHEIASDDGLKRYDGNLEAHQHMICEDSGRIVDVQVDPKTLKSLRPLDPETGKPLKDWEIGNVQITFRARRKR